MTTGSNDSASQRILAALRAAAHALTVTADWLGDRVEDFAAWIANLIRYLPARVGRIALTLGFAAVGLITFVPLGIRVWRRGGRANFSAWLRARARQGALRAVQLLLQALDLLGLPEIFALLWRAATQASPLTGAEISAAASVMGPFALRFQDVRVAQGGILAAVFRANGRRAFTTFHTVNVPAEGDHQRSNLDILLHELVHVYQYERAGSRYFAEALLAQHEEGYSYGGPEALQQAWGQGKRLRNFNREQQAQLVQDFYMYRRHGWETDAFEPYISELREGKI
jgi:hypothetical protein